MKFWIAREKDGSLWTYANKPILTKLGWGVDYDKCDSEPLKQLHESYFPEVTFENSPQMVEIKLVKDMIECFADEPQDKMVSLDKVCDILYDMLHDQWINDGAMVGTWAYENMEDFVEDFCKKLEE